MDSHMHVQKRYDTFTPCLQGSVRDKEKRERERQQLADLVGKNLTYISQLDGLDYHLYSTAVLPKVIDQVVSCKDDIAQQYLFQVSSHSIVYAFPRVPVLVFT